MIFYDVTGGYNMEFRRIEYFLVLAEKLNFNQAAKELCISAPALTKQIHLLEEELGTVLFERSTRHVQLTEDGILCQNQFASVKAHYEEALEVIQDSIKHNHRIVRIGFFAPLPKKELVNPIIHALTTEFGDVDFDFSTSNLDELRENVKSRKVDLGFTNAHDYEDWMGCDRIIFKTLPASIVVSANHPWVKSKKKTIEVADLADAEILLMIKHGPYEFNSFYARVNTRLRTFVPDFDTLLMELEKGKGFAVFPQAFNEMQHSRFAYYDLPEELSFKFHTMCGCSSSNTNPDVRKIFSYIKSHKEDYTF